MTPKMRSFLVSLTFLFIVDQTAFGSDVMDLLKAWEKEREKQKSLLFPERTSITVEIEYSAEQIDAIRKRARTAWKGYLNLRPKLRKHDTYEQAYARRAAALRFRIQSFENLLKEEKKKPTRAGPVTVGQALTWLDRATAAVEYDHGRVTLRMAQETILPPGRPFCICAGPAHLRLAPGEFRACPPVAAMTVSLAAGEAESFQLLVVPYWKPLRNLEVNVAPLFQRNSIARIGGEQVETWLVESIRNRPKVGRDNFWPDPLLSARPIDVPATGTQAILINLRADGDQAPGAYTGRITISARDVAPMEIHLRVLVRAFSITESLPTVGYWVRNENLKSCFTTDRPNRLAGACREFLASFALRLYRPANPGDDAAEGWVGWAPGYDLKLGEVSPSDPFSLAAPSSLPYRREGWRAWQLTHHGLGSNRWLISDWIAVGKSLKDSGDALVGPLIWGEWDVEEATPPPGLVYLDAASQPVPSLRLAALRDGIEDFAYQRLFAERLGRAEKSKAIGWLKRRKFRRLLEADPKILDPRANAEESEEILFRRRENLAEAIEKLDLLIQKAEAD